MPPNPRLDPSRHRNFCGSGSTGLAGVNVRRRFIGVEREADNAEIAALKVADADAEWPAARDPTSAA
jgi:DNA modification methylase